MNAKSIAELNQLLPERVGLIESPMWEAGRQVFSPVGRLRKPAAMVVRPTHVQEIAKVMQWATQTSTRVNRPFGRPQFRCLLGPE